MIERLPIFKIVITGSSIQSGELGRIPITLCALETFLVWHHGLGGQGCQLKRLVRFLIHFWLVHAIKVLEFNISCLLNHLQKLFFIFLSLSQCQRIQCVIVATRWTFLFLLTISCLFTIKLDSSLFWLLIIDSQELSIRFLCSGLLRLLILVFIVNWKRFQIISFYSLLLLWKVAEDARETLRIHVGGTRRLRHLIRIDNVLAILQLNGLQYCIRLREFFGIKHLSELLRCHVSGLLLDFPIIFLLAPFSALLLLFLHFQLHLQLLLIFVFLVDARELIQFLFKDVLLYFLFSLVFHVMDEGYEIVSCA